MFTGDGGTPALSLVGDEVTLPNDGRVTGGNVGKLEGCCREGSGPCDGRGANGEDCRTEVDGELREGDEERVEDLKGLSVGRRAG